MTYKYVNKTGIYLVFFKSHYAGYVIPSIELSFFNQNKQFVLSILVSWL